MTLSLDDAIRAQMRHAMQWNDIPQGDDDHDDCMGAYQLVADLVMLRVSVSDPEEALQDMIHNRDNDNWLGNVAADGVCPELANLIQDDDDLCHWCGDPGTEANPIKLHVVEPPTVQHEVHPVPYHEGCAHEAAVDYVI